MYKLFVADTTMQFKLYSLLVKSFKEAGNVECGVVYSHRLATRNYSVIGLPAPYT